MPELHNKRHTFAVIQAQIGVVGNGAD